MPFASICFLLQPLLFLSTTQLILEETLLKAELVPTLITHQIAHWEHGVELISHGVVLKGHEERVQHNAYGDT